MKKTFLLLVALVAVVGLFADNITSFPIPQLDRIVADTNFNGDANWTLTDNDFEWTNDNVLTSTIESGTTRNADNKAKISAKVNVTNGVTTNLWINDFSEAVGNNLAASSSKGEIPTDLDTYTSYDNELDALTLTGTDQAIIEGFYGGTWKLEDILNYRFVLDTRAVQGQSIIVTFTISGL